MSEMSGIGLLHLGPIGLEVDLATADPRALDLALLLDLVGIDGEGVVGQFDEVGEFSHLDGSQFGLATELAGTVDGVGPQSLIERDGLIATVLGRRTSTARCG